MASPKSAKAEQANNVAQFNKENYLKNFGSELVQVSKITEGKLSFVKYEESQKGFCSAVYSLKVGTESKDVRINAKELAAKLPNIAKEKGDKMEVSFPLQITVSRGIWTV